MMNGVTTTHTNYGKLEMKKKKKKRKRKKKKKVNLLSLNILLCVVGSPGRALQSR
jgi:hypothetical protein